MIRRRKSIITLLFVISFFLYVNWFISISNWPSLKQLQQQRKSSKLYRNVEMKLIKAAFNEHDLKLLPKAHQRQIIFELFEAYELNKPVKKNSVKNKAADDEELKEEQRNKNERVKQKVTAAHLNQFLLISAKDLTLHNQNQVITPSVNSGGDKVNRHELNFLFKLFFSNEAYMVDLELLDQIHFKSPRVNRSLELEPSESEFKYDVRKMETIKNYIEDETSQQKVFITLGINFQNVESLNKDLLNHLSPKCEYLQAGSNYNENSILASLYLVCGNKLVIQVAIFYVRGSFLWISNDNYNLAGHRKVFGDKPRAINFFNRSHIVDEDNNYFYIPSNLKRFRFEYNHSPFLECNGELARQNIRKLGAKYNQDVKKNKIVLPVIKHISQTMESMYKHYWLAGGTLLGWYRDCGIIPFTQDVDMAVWAHEYEPKIKRHFMGNEVVRVWGTLGLMNDSYELRLYNDLFTFDVFLVYKTSDAAGQWCGYQVNKSKFKRILPKFDQLCSAELFNNKFMIPCDPITYLDRDYGPGNWQTPQSVNYTWTNVKYWEKWTESQWPHTIKYYDRDGKLIKKKILEYVNKYMSEPITEVPLDDDFDIVNIY